MQNKLLYNDNNSSFMFIFFGTAPYAFQLFKITIVDK